MIEIARTNAKTTQKIDFLVDSCSKLEKVTSNYFDVVVANYVLMDVPDLQGTMNAFNRVLKDNGKAVLVFSHPCFPQGRATEMEDSIEVSYTWSFSYFEQKQCVDPPWGHFNSEFIWFHRSLSDYWKAFKSSGFEIIDFEEPRIAEERVHLAENERKLRKSKTRPYSVVFKLQKIRNL
jgi:ubiquinone/menaquinone biosynthesis C-methylase UbiE